MLTDDQRRELLLIRDEDNGYLARGDQAGLVRAGLAIPPMGGGFYYLSKHGVALRRLAKEGLGE